MVLGLTRCQTHHTEALLFLKVHFLGITGMFSLINFTFPGITGLYRSSCL